MRALRPHLRYGAYVARHKWFVLLAGLRLGVPVWQLLVHDLSKLRPREWFPYARYFYGGPPTPAAQAAFDRAWLAHQHVSPHHYQHWILREDSGAVKVLPMPHRFALEMLADWQGAGRALAKPDTAAWYARNRDRIQLHPLTRQIVEHRLGLHVDDAVHAPFLPHEARLYGQPRPGETLATAGADWLTLPVRYTRGSWEHPESAPLTDVMLAVSAYRRRAGGAHPAVLLVPSGRAAAYAQHPNFRWIARDARALGYGTRRDGLPQTIEGVAVISDPAVRVPTLRGPAAPRPASGHPAQED